MRGLQYDDLPRSKAGHLCCMCMIMSHALGGLACLYHLGLIKELWFYDSFIIININYCTCIIGILEWDEELDS